MERTNSRRRKAGLSGTMDEKVQESASIRKSLSSQANLSSPVVPIPLSPLQTWLRYFIYLIVSLLIFGFLGAILFGQLKSASRNAVNIGGADAAQETPAGTQVPGDLRIILHPENHASRPPTTLVYNWTITKGYRRPDGVAKEVYLLNDNFPGETIEARSGDRIIVNVTNQLSNEGLAMHWHGLRMMGANELDGAVGLTQNPIPPSGSFLYDFTIGQEESGTFWYHGHEKTQRDDGLYGGFVVHRPSEQCNERRKYDYDDEILLLVGDWYHRPSNDVLSWYMNSRSFGNEPVPDSLVINGLGNFDCELAVPARPVDCLSPETRIDLPVLPLKGGQRTRLRLVNTGSLTGFSVRIHGASITPFQVDGGSEIAMAEARGIGIVYPGERVDVVLQIGPSTNQPFVEIKMDDENFKYPNPALNPIQNFPVQTIADNVGMALPVPEVEHYNLQAASSNSSLRVAWPEQPLKFVIYTTTLKLAKHHNIPMGFINHTSWSPQAEPPEPLISISRSQYDRNQLSPRIPLFRKGTADTGLSKGWVEVVINNLDDGGHPFHLHGYSFYVVSVFPRPVAWTGTKPPFTPGGSSMYNYNPFTTQPQDSPAGEYNLVNPVIRDTVFVPQRGYAVIRFQADNMGIWMLHCHVGWHLGSGMAMSWDVQ